MDPTKKKHSKFSIKRITLFSIGLISFIFIGLFAHTFFAYQNLLSSFSFSSPIAPHLAIFAYNKSQHTDPVPGCWYDSGDYVVFIQRNTQTLFYLSSAFKEANDPSIKNDLRAVIDDQLACVQRMLALNYKQFRDQSSHGIPLPPRLHNTLYPQNFYTFSEGEGRDVHLLLSLIYANMGDLDKSAHHRKLAKSPPLPTVSTNCCEEGPLSITQQELHALEILNGSRQTAPLEIWGSSFGAFASFNIPDIRGLRNVLISLSSSADPFSPFSYIGSNYDIAGFVSTIKLYEQKTSDPTFTPLAKDFMEFLGGNNPDKVSFTHYNTMYHPCHFFKSCSLTQTLINGYDEQRTFDKSRFDLWRLTEVQLVGQAEYVLAYILFHDL